VRRALALLLGLVCLAPAAALAQAGYPARQVRMIMPFPPGSSTDIVARVMADQLSRKWGQNVFVDNVVGATGNIGAADVFRAAPDGYTLLFSPPTAFATNHFLFKNIGYDAAKWSPLGLVSTVPYMLAARPDFPGSTVGDLVDYARRNPNKTTFASAGVGSTIQLAAIELGRRAGVELVHVPFRGAAPALTGVMAGQVDFLFDVISTSIPAWKDGKLKALGVGSPEPSEFLPGVPTIASQGYPGFRAMTWFAVAGPPGMAPGLVDKINGDIRAILALPEVVARIRGIQMEPAPASPADTRKWFDEEAGLWGGIISAAGVVVDE
jgi:tripartite-type tricarboxylate transporter receptor subunit TctC